MTDLRATMDQLVGTVRANAQRVNRASRGRSAFVAELIERSRTIGDEIATLREQSKTAQSHLNLTAEAAESLTGEVQAIVNLLDQTLEDIAALDEQAKAFEQSFVEVNSVSRAIMDVAERTNILSLNAMIEAARAGEEGAGFQVVANEVRELAGLTGSSAQEISQKIESLLGDTAAMSHQCAQMREATEKGVRQGKANLSGVTEIRAGLVESVSKANLASDEAAQHVAQFASLIEDMEALKRDTEAAISGSGDNIAVADRLDDCIANVRRLEALQQSPVRGTDTSDRLALRAPV